MARNTRGNKLETRTTRLRLPVAKKPVYVKIDRGVALGYRRNAGAGTWVVRVTRDGRDWTTKLGPADDYEENGSTLTWWTAQARARDVALGQYEADTSKPVTVAGALDTYELDLETRGADPRNAGMVRTQLPPALAAKQVALLTARELRAFRDGLLKAGLRPASVTRVAKVFKAALNLAASHDPRITNSAAWRTGLAALPDGERARNVILPEVGCPLHCRCGLGHQSGNRPVRRNRGRHRRAPEPTLPAERRGPQGRREPAAQHALEQEGSRAEAHHARSGTDSGFAGGQAEEQPGGGRAASTASRTALGARRSQRSGQRGSRQSEPRSGRGNHLRAAALLDRPPAAGRIPDQGGRNQPRHERGNDREELFPAARLTHGRTDACRDARPGGVAMTSEVDRRSRGAGGSGRSGGCVSVRVDTA